MADEIRVAMIGATGHFYILSAFGVIDGLKPVAFAHDGYGGVHARAAEHDCPTWDDYRRMLDEVRPDVAALGCWYAHNGEAALECLRRGIHVLSEKPPLNDWDQWREAKALCDADPGLHYLTEFELRAHPAFAAARGAVTQGLIGRPVLARAQKSYRFGTARPDFYRLREHYAGTLMWVASHAIDLLPWATGLDYLDFSGFQGNISRPDYGEMEDHVAVIAKMSGGAGALLTADFLRPAKAPTHGDDRLRIAGTEGIVEVINDECVLLTNSEEPRVLAAGREGGEGIAEKFVKTLRGEGDGTFSTGETLRSAAWLLAAREAVDSGGRVSMHDTPAGSE